jgi:hypothetical protein
MRPEVIRAFIDGGIFLLGGVYGILIGYRIIGKGAGVDFKYDQWHERFGRMLRVLGPLLIVYGIFHIVRELVAAK